MNVDISIPEKGIIHKYVNGNCDIEIYEDGTRVISTDDDFLSLEYPLNVDIRVSTYCSFGVGKDGKAVCSFCHESASKMGRECDYSQLTKALEGLPRGMELAIGCNELTEGLEAFIRSVGHKFVINLTVNQGHIPKFASRIVKMQEDKVVWGVGVSFRGFLGWKIPDCIVNNDLTVMHVIAGIDKIRSVLDLRKRGIRKILVLGEKDFGFNQYRVDLNSKSHQEWRKRFKDLFTTFDVVSFDNLALEQLPVKEVFSEEQWNTLYQFEESFYIDAVAGHFKTSSRVAPFVDWNSISAVDYYRQHVKSGKV